MTCLKLGVVDYTAKVQIFEQITTMIGTALDKTGCWLYRKGTNFRANHNYSSKLFIRYIVVDYTAKVQIFEQITTEWMYTFWLGGCWLYRKGTNFRANHNYGFRGVQLRPVVDYTARYKFSSKSQQEQKEFLSSVCCWLYRKGTNFRANHNYASRLFSSDRVVDYTAKVQIFEQITTVQY